MSLAYHGSDHLLYMWPSTRKGTISRQMSICCTGVISQSGVIWLNRVFFTNGLWDASTNSLRVFTAIWYFAMALQPGESSRLAIASSVRGVVMREHLQLRIRSTRKHNRPTCRTNEVGLCHSYLASLPWIVSIVIPRCSSSTAQSSWEPERLCQLTEP